MLRDTDLQETFRKAYIPEVLATDVAADHFVSTEKATLLSTTNAPEMSSAYPIVQPIKAALFFDTPDGFGEWRIYVSTRASSNLRRIKKKDPNLFNVTIKKIKYVSCLHSVVRIAFTCSFPPPRPPRELSHGHFSEDNQKRLNGLDTQIPIFEAKTTRDSRLIVSYLTCKMRVLS